MLVPSDRTLTRPLALLCGLLLGVTTIAGAAALGQQAAPDLSDSPIIAVEGDAGNGFSLHRLDGTSQHPPTRSESLAECGEYDAPIDVAVCEAEVETELAWIAQVQASLHWATSDEPSPVPGDSGPPLSR